MRAHSQRRLPVQASVRTSPNPIITGGHALTIAPLKATAFDAGTKFHRRECSNAAVISLLLMSQQERHRSSRQRTTEAPQAG